MLLLQNRILTRFDCFPWTLLMVSVYCIGVLYLDETENEEIDSIFLPATEFHCNCLTFKNKV